MDQEQLTTKHSDTSHQVTDKAQTKRHDDDDRFGSLANIDAAPTLTPSPSPIQDELDDIEHSFGWFNDDAQQGLEKLRVDMKREDEPAWFEVAAHGVLSAALGAGAAAAGVHVASKLVKKTQESLTELVKVSFESGVVAGVSAGGKVLGKGKANDVIDPFIDSQKEGLRAGHRARQSHFLRVGRHQIKTIDEAKRLAAACSQENVKEASNEQYKASRDAWLSYLAQSRYGSMTAWEEMVTTSTGNPGPTTTNMKTTRERGGLLPDGVPTKGPERDAAFFGVEGPPGVLVATASLPEIYRNELRGKSKIKQAYLDGVNGTIRQQYENVPIGKMKIPRILSFECEGEEPDFQLTLDENEREFVGPATGHKERAWLAARATIGRPENYKLDYDERYQEGKRLLLAELAATSIRSKG